MIQERRHFLSSEIGGMPFASEIDEAPDPVEVGFLGPVAHVTSSDLNLHLFQQTPGLSHPWLLPQYVRCDSR